MARATMAFPTYPRIKRPSYTPQTDFRKFYLSDGTKKLNGQNRCWSCRQFGTRQCRSKAESDFEFSLVLLHPTGRRCTIIRLGFSEYVSDVGLYCVLG